MIDILVRHDPNELAALEARVRASIRSFGNAAFLADLERLIEVEDDYHALKGLNRHGAAMNPWRVRSGRSDFHGRNYRAFTNRVTLVPFGRDSRRIAARVVEIKRRSVAGIGFGGVTASVGFNSRAGLVPSYWARRDRTRDVLGMPPRTRRAVGLLCTRHAGAAHRMLKRGAAGVSRSAAAFLS